MGCGTDEGAGISKATAVLFAAVALLLTVMGGAVSSGSTVRFSAIAELGALHYAQASMIAAPQMPGFALPGVDESCVDGAAGCAGPNCSLNPLAVPSAAPYIRARQSGAVQLVPVQDIMPISTGMRPSLPPPRRAP